MLQPYTTISLFNSAKIFESRVNSIPATKNHRA